MSDPSLLVTRPTATDPTLAPPGNDLLFVLAPCPNLERGRIDWARVGPAYRDELLAVLAARAHPGLDDIAGDIDGLAAGDPGRLGGRRPGRGHPVLGGAHVRADGSVPSSQPRAGPGQRRAGGLRHGAGVGIPPVVLSGKLAAQRITGDGPGPEGSFGRVSGRVGAWIAS